MVHPFHMYLFPRKIRSIDIKASQLDMFEGGGSNNAFLTDYMSQPFLMYCGNSNSNVSYVRFLFFQCRWLLFKVQSDKGSSTLLLRMAAAPYSLLLRMAVAPYSTLLLRIAAAPYSTVLLRMAAAPYSTLLLRMAAAPYSTLLLRMAAAPCSSTLQHIAAANGSSTLQHIAAANGSSTLQHIAAANGSSTNWTCSLGTLKS